ARRAEGGDGPHGDQYLHRRRPWRHPLPRRHLRLLLEGELEERDLAGQLPGGAGRDGAPFDGVHGGVLRGRGGDRLSLRLPHHRPDGADLAGAVPESERMNGAVTAWVKALRLKFYPMSWLTYALGAVAAAGVQALGDGAF